MSAQSPKELVREFLINPKWSAPFIWALLITLFLYSMALTMWVYADWVDKENSLQELEEKVFNQEIRLLLLEGQNPYNFNFTSPMINIEEVPLQEFNVYGLRVNGPPSTVPPAP